MKTKYTTCIGLFAKNAADKWRLKTGVGRVPLSRLIHKDYMDNRTPAAKRESKFSARTRPVNVQTNLDDSKVVELLELANMLDIIARYDSTDSGMISNLLGSFLDAVIMGDLVDTTAPFISAEELSDINVSGRMHVAEMAGEYNLNKAAGLLAPVGGGSAPAPGEPDEEDALGD